MTENLTLKAAILLSGERRGVKRAQALRLFAELMRQGVELPPEAVEFIAKSLEDHADTMPKSTPQGGTTTKAGMFFGLAMQAIMQALGVTRAKAKELLLAYLAEHGEDEPSDKKIKRQIAALDEHGACVWDDAANGEDCLPSIRRVLEWTRTEWTRTREVSA